MRGRMEKSCLLFLVHVVLTVQGQKEGDVRLLDNGGPTFQGVLQVYTQNNWNIVCDNRGYTNDDRAAAAACRTLGHATYSKWGSAISLGFDVYSNGKNYQPTAINGIRCPNVINLVTEAELFLMRCDVGNVINSSTCDPQTIVGIKCDTSINNYYNGQVRILSQYDSDHEQNNDLLEIYLEQDWRPVCVNSSNVNGVFADSACRQMGYTGAESYRPYVSNTHQISWKINIQPVCSAAEGVRISYPCLTNCMNHSTYASQDSCDADHEKFVLLTCQFIKLDQVFWSSGNQFICTYPNATAPSCIIDEAGVAAIIIAIPMLLVAAILGIIICYLFRDQLNKILHKCKRAYKPVDGDDQN